MVKRGSRSSVAAAGSSDPQVAAADGGFGVSRMLPIGVLGVMSAVLVWRAFHFDFTADDAFISLRYARNLVEGRGLVFNPGDRVEGFTSILHVLVLAALKLTGLDLLNAARGLGLVAAVGLLVLVYRGALTATGTSGRWFALAATAGLALNPYLAIWSLSGLETLPFAFLLIATVNPLLRAGGGRRSFLSVSLLAAALTLTRPEGIVVYAFCCAWWLVAGEESCRRRLTDALPGLALYGAVLSALLLWRWSYYGDWLPNTFYVKSAFSLRHVSRGLAYLGAYAMNFAVVPTLLLVGAGLAARRTRAGIFFLLLLLGLLTVVVLEGGDGLPAYRFLVPCLAPFFLLAAVAARSLAERWAPATPIAASVMAGVLGLLLAGAAVPRNDQQYRYYSYHRRMEVPLWSLVGSWLKANVPAETVVATVPIGAVGYYSELRIIDMLGLTERHIARVETAQLGSGWAGHEKTDAAYVIAQRPEILLLGNIYASSAPVRDLAMFAPLRNANIYAREKDILSQPAFREHYRLASVAIAPGRFLNAFFRTDFLAKLRTNTVR